MLEISTLYFKTEKNFEAESHFVAQANLILDRALCFSFLGETAGLYRHSCLEL